MVSSSGPAVPLSPNVLTIEVTHFAMSNVTDGDTWASELYVVIKLDIIDMTLKSLRLA